MLIDWIVCFSCYFAGFFVGRLKRKHDTEALERANELLEYIRNRDHLTRRATNAE